MFRIGEASCGKVGGRVAGMFEGGQAQSGTQKAPEKEDDVRVQMKEWIRTCGGWGSP